MYTINRRIFAVLITIVSIVPLTAQTRVYQSITDGVALRVIATVEEDTTILRSYYAERPEGWVCRAFPDRLECTLDYIIEGTITPNPAGDGVVFEENGRSHRFSWEDGVYRMVKEPGDTADQSTEIRIQRTGTTVSATVLDWYEEGVLEFPTQANGQYRYSASDSESVFINVSDEEIAIFNPAYPEEFRSLPRAVGDQSLRLASVLPEPPRFPDLSRPVAQRLAETAPYTTLSIDSMREIAFGGYAPVAIDPSGERVFALRSASAEETTLALFSLPDGRTLAEVVLPFAYRPMLEHVAWSPSGEQLVTSTRSTYYADVSDSGLLILDSRNGSGGFITDKREDSFPFWIDESRFAFLRYDEEALDSEVDLLVATRGVEPTATPAAASTASAGANAGAGAGANAGATTQTTTTAGAGAGAAIGFRVSQAFPNVASYLATADIAFLPATGELYLSSLPLSGRDADIRRFRPGAVEPAPVTVTPFSPSEDTTYIGDTESTGAWSIVWPRGYLEAGPNERSTTDAAVPSIVSLRDNSRPHPLLPEGSPHYLYAATVAPDGGVVVYATYDPRTRREALVLRGVKSGRVQGPPITILSRENLGFDPFQSARSYGGSLRWTDPNTILYIRSDLNRVVVIDLTVD
jgi:hypothetical protein